MTPERAKEVIDTLLDDDALIDIATSASRKDVRLAAEMHLRRRYPSKVKIKSDGAAGAAREAGNYE